MALWVDGIDRPTQDEFKKHERILRKYTVRVPDPDFESAEAFDVLEDVLRSANTVQNYYRQRLAGGGSKRRRDDADTPDISDNENTRSKVPRVTANRGGSRDVDSSDDENTRSKVPRVTANKKRSRDDSGDDEDASRSSKMPRMTANKKRSRGTSDTSGDEGKSKPSKKARLGAQKVEMKQAVRELQDIFNSSSKGSK